MPYDDPFWLPPHREMTPVSPRSAYAELHDYDFEMRGPYRPGKLLDAYMEWREFRRQERIGRVRPALDDAQRLLRWEAWRRRRRHPEFTRRFQERRRGPVGGPRWPREGL